MFINDTQDNAPSAPIAATDPREVLVWFLASGKVSTIQYRNRADAYAAVSVDDDRVCSVREPWAGTAADHTYFGLA